MQADTWHPFDPGKYPLAGQRMRPAWEAALGWFAEHPDRWSNPREVADHMTAASDVTDKTCLILLRQARQYGFLQVKPVSKFKLLVKPAGFWLPELQQYGAP